MAHPHKHYLRNDVTEAGRGNAAASPPKMMIFADDMHLRLLVDESILPLASIESITLKSFEQNLDNLITQEIRSLRVLHHVCATLPPQFTSLLPPGSQLSTMRCDICTCSGGRVPILLSGEPSVFEEESVLEENIRACLAARQEKVSLSVPAETPCSSFLGIRARMGLSTVRRSHAIAHGLHTVELHLQAPQWASQVIRQLAGLAAFSGLAVLGIVAVDGNPVAAFSPAQPCSHSARCAYKMEQPPHVLGEVDNEVEGNCARESNKPRHLAEVKLPPWWVPAVATKARPWPLSITPGDPAKRLNPGAPQSAQSTLKQADGDNLRVNGKVEHRLDINSLPQEEGDAAEINSGNVSQGHSWQPPSLRAAVLPPPDLLTLMRPISRSKRRVPYRRVPGVSGSPRAWGGPNNFKGAEGVPHGERKGGLAGGTGLKVGTPGVPTANGSEAYTRVASLAKPHGCSRRQMVDVTKNEFLRDLREFLVTRNHTKLVPPGPLEHFPEAVLNGLQLDLFTLYREVVSRGGFHVGNGINWKGQIFSKMHNYTPTHRCTGVGNTLKKHYETYLLEYELSHDDVAREFCMICQQGTEGDWVNCGSCHAWAHWDCDHRSGLGFFKDYAKSEGREYKCLWCSGQRPRSKLQRVELKAPGTQPTAA